MQAKDRSQSPTCVIGIQTLETPKAGTGERNSGGEDITPTTDLRGAQGQAGPHVRGDNYHQPSCAASTLEEATSY